MLKRVVCEEILSWLQSKIPVHAEPWNAPFLSELHILNKVSRPSFHKHSPKCPSAQCIDNGHFISSAFWCCLSLSLRPQPSDPLGMRVNVAASPNTYAMPFTVLQIFRWLMLLAPAKSCRRRIWDQLQWAQWSDASPTNPLSTVLD